MYANHKNKTLATLLTALLGGVGAYRFYLYGPKDIWAWAHLLSLPLAYLIGITIENIQPFFAAIPFLISVLAGFLEALVIGLTPDDKWDTVHNPQSGIQSQSGWPLALMLVLTFGVSTVLLIATLARLFDLLFTGGAYG